MDRIDNEMENSFCRSDDQDSAAVKALHIYPYAIDYVFVSGTRSPFTSATIQSSVLQRFDT